MFNYSSPVSTQTKFDSFLNFFQENFRILRILSKFLKISNLSKHTFELVKYVHAKFRVSTQMDLDTFLTFFHEKFIQNFSGKH
jgi:hypothetical protein